MRRWILLLIVAVTAADSCTKLRSDFDNPSIHRWIIEHSNLHFVESSYRIVDTYRSINAQLDYSEYDIIEGDPLTLSGTISILPVTEDRIIFPDSILGRCRVNELCHQQLASMHYFSDQSIFRIFVPIGSTPCDLIDQLDNSGIWLRDQGSPAQICEQIWEWLDVDAIVPVSY